MKYTDEFIKDLPKTDLHLHLDGSLRLETLIEAAKKNNIELPSFTKEGLKELVFKENYNNLGEYLNGFQYTCNVLRDLETLERSSYELAIDNQNEGVNYIEVRFAPQLLIDEDSNLQFENIIEAVNNGLERAAKEYNNSKKVISDGYPPFNYGIICCAMRMFGPKGFSPYYSNIFETLKYSSNMDIIKQASMEMVKAAIGLRDQKNIPIVGIDLAGQEEGYPAHKFKEAYAYAHTHFMHKTVHAGEAYGAESIFEAITQCHADRIGHGYALFMPDMIRDKKITDKEKFIKDLASFMADKRTVMEVCLTSNLQTNPAITNIKTHKFKDMLENRMATTICTDNRLVSNTTISKELKLATDNFDIPLKRLKDILAYGFKKSFFHGSYVEKRKYAKTNMQYFDKIVSKHGLEH